MQALVGALDPAQDPVRLSIEKVVLLLRGAAAATCMSAART